MDSKLLVTRPQRNTSMFLQQVLLIACLVADASFASLAAVESDLAVPRAAPPAPFAQVCVYRSSCDTTIVCVVCVGEGGGGGVP